MARHTTKRPQPLLDRAKVITGITVLAAVLVRLNLGNAADWLTDYEDPIAGVVLASGTLWTAISSRRHVTPVAKPQDNDGNDLVPAGSGLDADAAARASLAAADAIHPSDGLA